MSVIVSLTVKIFIFLIIGYVACMLKIVDDVAKEKLSNLLVNIILPVSMLASSQQKFSTDNLQGLGKIAVIATIYYVLMFVLGALVFKVIKTDQGTKTISILLVAFANTAFLGIPIITEIAGETGTLYAVIYNCVFDVLYFSIGMYMLNKSGNDIKLLFTNPMVWISIITVILYVLPFRLPVIIVEPLSSFGSIMMPVSMLIIGAQICQMKFTRLFTEKAAYLMSFLRMLVIPGITYGVMVLIKADPEIMATAVILAAMPSASMNVIMAEKYRANPELATVTVMQNTILMIFTLPLFMYLC